MKEKQEKTLSFLLWKGCQTLSYQKSQCSSEGFVLHWSIYPPNHSKFIWQFLGFGYVFLPCRDSIWVTVERNGSMSAEGVHHCPLNWNFVGTNGQSSELVVCWPRQRRNSTLMDLASKARWEMPAPQEVGCKQQMNTAGGLRAGQQP